MSQNRTTSTRVRSEVKLGLEHDENVKEPVKLGFSRLGLKFSGKMIMNSRRISKLSHCARAAINWCIVAMLVAVMVTVLSWFAVQLHLHLNAKR